MKTLLIAVALLSSTAFATCPITVVCTQDGEVMHSTGTCHAIDQHNMSCEFTHSHVDRATNKSQTHNQWVNCPH